MDPDLPLFEQHRGRLFGLAYRMLGTPADAEDVLHDAWLRLHAQDVAALDDPEAWLVTVTTRLALDRLRRARAEREHYTGPWLPEPLAPESERPDAVLERDESLTLSFLLLLERLGPEERAAFLLHEVFEYSHGEAAAILGIAEWEKRREKGSGSFSCPIRLERNRKLPRQADISESELLPRWTMCCGMPGRSMRGCLGMIASVRGDGQPVPAARQTES